MLCEQGGGKPRPYKVGRARRLPSATAIGGKKTMSTREELEKRRSSLPAAKQFLLEKRKQKIASLGERADVIARRPLGVPVPASFAQQRFWFLHQLQPDNTAYNEIRTFRAPMQLDSDVLKRALLEVMRRHEILRTTFSFKDGKLQQLVHAYEGASAAF